MTLPTAAAVHDGWISMMLACQECANTHKTKRTYLSIDKSRIERACGFVDSSWLLSLVKMRNGRRHKCASRFGLLVQRKW